MIDNGYIYLVDKSRMFINASLGCIGGCSYCYLSKIGYSNKRIISEKKSAEEIIDFIEAHKQEYNKDTLISMGCFSECFDKFNKTKTIKLIKYFLNKGNQIQVSTKKKLNSMDIKEIIPSIQYYRQLIIFVSCASISMHKSIEKNTDYPYQRFKNFKYSKDIPIILYIKPILKDITIKDIDLYEKYISKYHINDVVVGSIFTENKSKETVHFSNENKLFYNKIEDEMKIINELKEKCNVYRRSSEVTKKFKK